MAEVQRWDVAIVGGGPAGLSAGLVLARARRRVLVVDAGEPRNAPAAHVRGFLSRDGDDPAEVLRIGRDEVGGYGGAIRAGRVTSAAREHDELRLELADGGRLAARRLLVATSLIDQLPDIPGLAERWGTDVLHCPYCHGREVADRPLGVIAAAGPLAVHQALLLRQWSPDVVLFAHTAELTGEQRTQLAARDIHVVEGEVAAVVVTDGRLTGVALADGRVVARAAVFAIEGMRPADDLLVGLGAETDESLFGPLVRTDPTGRTTVPGVWAAGNVVDPQAQVVSAASQGSRAAIALNADLVEEEVAEAVVRLRG